MGSYKIIWTLAFLLNQQAVYKDVPEHYVFKSEAECNEFGEKMHKRTEDWARGALHATWETPITVLWRCDQNGERS